MNEDYHAVGPDWAFVLDGATAPSDVDSGCAHDVAWLVHRLGAELAGRLAVPGQPLADVLAEAIAATCAAHADTCDLRNPSSPSSTVSILRAGDEIEYLVLADSPIAFDHGAIVDDRLDHLPSYTWEAVRDLRNQPGGFWVASTKPEAAYEAVRGTLRDVRRAALLSDGASRYVEKLGLGDWPDLLDLLEKAGPAELLTQVRTAEAASPKPRRGKQHDDATAVFLLF
ncbi:protein phosphatase 2C domain-containing protein [Saccharopolyspora hirsuta]|uniref:protein phosphatase 2C domain-containing protein n=1 Tax=Saccharopolyspora hirsuta TaxID=1837 RepID=UPI001FEA5F0C|nr:protein phosphatase 2C domain-containing protein [Saccharopolyspora hirsuta]